MEMIEFLDKNLNCLTKMKDYVLLQFTSSTAVLGMMAFQKF